MVSGENRADVLVLAAHPDDAEIFCGGTIATLADEGRRVVIVDLTAGELASNGTVEERRRNSLEAARILGADENRPVLGLPDGSLHAHDPIQVEKVVAVLREFGPRLVVAPYPQDRHPDHEAAGELVRRAFFFSGVARFGLSAGPARRPARLVFCPGHHDVRPDLLVDVGGAMERWREAVGVYGSQFRRTDGSTETWINRPGFLDALAARRSHWGSLCGVDHAEGFVHSTPWKLERASDLLGPLGESDA